MNKIVILILAAGNSSRMGAIKQLLPWQEGTLIENAIKQAKASIASDVIVVLGANHQKIEQKINHQNAILVINDTWESGLGSSIACGINYIDKSLKNTDAVLVMLADQPLIKTEFLNHMMRKFINGNTNIVATKYEQKAGVPAIFGSDYFKELSTLSNDFGAKMILEKNKSLILLLEAQGITFDVDSPEDYDRIKKESLPS